MAERPLFEVALERLNDRFCPSIDADKIFIDENSGSWIINRVPPNKANGLNVRRIRQETGLTFKLLREEDGMEQWLIERKGEGDGVMESLAGLAQRVSMAGKKGAGSSFQI